MLTYFSIRHFTSSANVFGLYSGCIRIVFGPPSELDNLATTIDQIPTR